MKAVQRIALETAAKAAKEKILALASKGEIKLSPAWQPTALISIINRRTDLSDADKIKLAARAKMEGNLKELLPQKFSVDKEGEEKKKKKEEKEDPLAGKLKFAADAPCEAGEVVDPMKKWQTVMFADLDEEKKPGRKEGDKAKVNSLRARFETKNMKDNEAYVIM
jgi:hypothetical protein